MPPPPPPLKIDFQRLIEMAFDFIFLESLVIRS